MDAPPVQYVTTSDGFHIAYAVTGEGVPLLYMHPIGHVQNDWYGPATRPWLEALCQLARLVQYDCRGQGMSTRGLPESISITDYELDIDALVDRLKLDAFVFMGSFWYGHVAVRYASLHPDRVRGLILLHCSAGRSHMGTELARQNWDVFLETLVTAPGWSADQRLAAIESFRQSMTQADWLAKEAAIEDSDVSDLLPRLSMPALVLHARDNNRQHPDDSAELAALLPNAQFALIGGSHQLGDAAEGARVVEAFLRERISPAAPKAGSASGLSERELEVLRLLAVGKSNAQIANQLVISLNTVNRHVSNIYAKIGAANRAEAVTYAHRQGLVS